MPLEPASALPDGVRAAIRQRLPDADLANAAFLDRGIGTMAYRFTDPSGSWVARLCDEYPKPWTWRGGRGYEVPLLRELRCRNLPVARDSFEVALTDGRPAAIVEREIDGTPATQLPAECRDRLVHQLGSFLWQLHAVPVDTARSLGVREVRTCLELREALHASEDHLSKDTRRWIADALTELDRSEAPRTLIHGDFRPDHWYCTPLGTLTGVIDFGDAAIDDPALDFARIPNEFVDDNDTSTIDQLAAHYGSPAPDAIVTRARIYRSLLPLFEIVGADDVDWWNRDDAVSQLAASAAAAGFPK